MLVFRRLSAASGLHQWQHLDSVTNHPRRRGGRAQDVVEFARRNCSNRLELPRRQSSSTRPALPWDLSTYLHPRATGRVSVRFYLNDGVVHGRRILPEGWVNYSARQPWTPTMALDLTNRGSHGDANARIHAGMPEDSFYGSGNLGQRIVIIPSAGLVIVRLGLTHYNGLQITAMKRLGHGFMGQLNYTWSRCMDTVPMADSCSSRREESCPRSPET